MTLEDSAIIGNCGFHYGQSFTCTSGNCGASFDTCRANGICLAFVFWNNNSPKLYTSSLLCNGDVGISTDAGGSCTSGTDVIVSGNILYGGREFNDDTGINGAGGNDTSSIYYEISGSCNTDFVETYNVCYGWKEGASACNGTGSSDTVDPGFSGTILMGPLSSPGYYTSSDFIDQLTLSAALDHVDETISGADSVDYNNYDRGAVWDNGAFEYGTSEGASSTQSKSKITGGIRLSGSARIQ
jgi:hypothetical protein